MCTTNVLATQFSSQTVIHVQSYSRSNKFSRHIFAEYQHKKKGKYINSKLQIIIPIIIITMKTAIIK